jgi:hypothetical protein
MDTTFIPPILKYRFTPASLKMNIFHVQWTVETRNESSNEGLKKNENQKLQQH